MMCQSTIERLGTEDLKKFVLLQENEKRDQQQNKEYNQLLAQYGHEIVKNPSILQPVKEKEEEVDKSKLPMQEELYIKSKKKGKNQEEEAIFSLAICRGSVCIPVDMDFATARAYCEAANKLLLSDDPNDRAKGERAWELLAQGKEAESMKLPGVGPITTKSKMDLKNQKWSPRPRTQILGKILIWLGQHNQKFMKLSIDL